MSGEIQMPCAPCVLRIMSRVPRCFAPIDRDFAWMPFKQNWKAQANPRIFVPSVTIGEEHERGAIGQH
ncbi:hypothetical protein ELI00_32570 (plasmid) [Rhizobium ruizarguesonis]|uniref:Uncharacterized protein n=1 Tax=Rhizobium ruizarguesonis TaxID=2081791 RepID=A0AAE8PRW0_9HYPH|nr:hypothetical protein ELI10_33335 [Rhizobium ruizarguesonis]TAX03020.1 hypothetical protein ELI09_33250 [Rhizobium ruizarguesonis]TAX65514.1 hypothetical protein ELI00_32570 [Rhizobium ruizarguesonis]TAZ67934.1 hypothetical protein ELH68_33395 [Rhizobium ruizarguesonis]TBB41373.1 hypothetical protein ELH44_31495 [Rhizobium ruizarguesonis]